MRVVTIVVCASLASACFATEGLKIGALPYEEPERSDASSLEDAGLLEPPELDAAAFAQDAALSSARDASIRPRPEDDGEDHDGGEHDDARAASIDAGLDAAHLADAGNGLGAIDSAMIDAGPADSGLNDAGSDAARSLLCTLEPWHCL
jgi:hypothetical protein